ncbi:MAG: phospho-N-acetylmuramoyl-pentapeptide-transferase [Lactobacillus sp.]|nr:phospho-N-acetylmuramoyl-pentapeptide-transferase [Lactobacillus sp.]
MGIFLAVFISSMVLTSLLIPWLIIYMHIHREGQEIRDEGPKWHQKKSGTPTMGGVVFVLVAAIIPMFFSGWNDLTYLLILINFLGYGLIGFSDDFLKIHFKRNLGLRAWQKASLQLLLAIITFVILAVGKFKISSPIPFFGPVVDMIIAYLFIIIWMVGFSNAVNLSDGLDGLASGLSVISFGFYAWLAYLQDEIQIMYFCISVMGALIGFLFYNHKPAKIFMGDAGSLALGGVLAVISILLGHPLSLLLIGIVFVLETASVILQVISFKTTGKRIFKMSPIHHHFEMCGWSEWKVDIVFWIVQLIGGLIYLQIWG